MEFAGALSCAGSAARAGSCSGGAASEQQAHCDAETSAGRRRSSVAAERTAGRRWNAESEQQR
eukprot:4811526-Alexandrium_andersonii.AAC.1